MRHWFFTDIKPHDPGNPWIACVCVKAVYNRKIAGKQRGKQS